MSKTVRVRIAHVTRAILRLQAASETNAFALNVDRDGYFVVQPAPDTRGGWLSVGYVHCERGSKRAADRAARQLINQCAKHLERYPNMFGDSIARVREASHG